MPGGWHVYSVRIVVGAGKSGRVDIFRNETGRRLRVRRVHVHADVPTHGDVTLRLLVGLTTVFPDTGVLPLAPEPMRVSCDFVLEHGSTLRAEVVNPTSSDVSVVLVLEAVEE